MNLPVAPPIRGVLALSILLWLLLFAWGLVAFGAVLDGVVRFFKSIVQEADGDLTVVGIRLGVLRQPIRVRSAVQWRRGRRARRPRPPANRRS